MCSGRPKTIKIQKKISEKNLYDIEFGHDTKTAGNKRRDKSDLIEIKNFVHLRPPSKER